MLKNARYDSFSFTPNTGEVSLGEVSVTAEFLESILLSTIIQVSKKRVLPLSTLERNHGCNNTVCHGLPELYIVLAPVVQKM